MKKVLFGLFICLGFISTSQAGIFDETGDRTVRVSYSTYSFTTMLSSSVVLIDLSDTSGFPHKETREINISSIRVNFDKAAASTATVRIGVVNFVDTSTGSITWFYEIKSDLNVSNTNVELFRNYNPNFIRTRVEGGTASCGDDCNGTTPYLFSNSKTNGSTTYQTDVKLLSVTGTNVFPGRGDIVMEWTKAGSAMNITVDIDYNTPTTR